MTKNNIILKFWLTLITGTILIVVIYLLTKVLNVVPIKYSNLVEALFVSIILYILLKIFLRVFEKILLNKTDKGIIKPIIFTLSILGYFIIILSALAIMGVDLSSVVLGSAFGSVIIGMAAQTVLSNFFGGVLILWAKPFIIGDYVEISTWQYNYMLPTASPKFFSRDEFRASIRGIVEDISIFFIIIKEPEGTFVKIPNNIVIQSTITTNVKDKFSTIRIEIPRNMDYKSLKDNIESELRSFEQIKYLSIVIEEITISSYLIRINFNAEIIDKDELRSEILERISSKIPYNN